MKATKCKDLAPVKFIHTHRISQGVSLKSVDTELIKSLVTTIKATVPLEEKHITPLHNLLRCNFLR